MDYSQIFYPKQFLLTKEGRLSLITSNSEHYSFYNENLKQLIQGVFQNATFEESTDTEFQKACRMPSVFIDFYNPISFQMLGDYYDAPITSHIMELSNVKHMLVMLTADGSSATIYAKNNMTGVSYKISFGGDISLLTNRTEDILKKVDPSSKSYSYAFDNSFDQPSPEEQNPQRLLIDSYMIINIAPVVLPRIYAEPVPEAIGGYDLAFYDKIARVFGMNINSARPFTDSNETVNFVENVSTLKFHKNGLMEYNAVAPEKGVPLSNALNSDYDVIKSAGEFFESINSLVARPEKNEYIFNNIVRDPQNDNRYTITFDILYNGVPVIFKHAGDGSESLKSSVSIEIENGKITSYQEYFIGFKQQNATLPSSLLIDALDQFYLAYDTKKNQDVTILDAYPIYSLDPAGTTVELKWAVSLSNHEVVIVSPKQEGGGPSL